MISVDIYRGQNVVVFGLGRTGLATAAALREGGARVIVADDNAANVDAGMAAGFEMADLRQADWRGIAALVLSPGVPLTHPAPHWTVTMARDHGVPIIGDMDLFFRARAAKAPATPVVAITGTNGKSTTTALVGHLLAAAGRPVSVGGNIGTAVLSLPPMDGRRAYVIEMSSYQVDLTQTLDASVGMLMNITPDHLDRHGTIETYAAVKARLPAAAETAVITVDDAWCAAIADSVEARGGSVVRLSTKCALSDGLWSTDGAIHVSNDGRTRRLFSLVGIETLRGEHNWQNALAATAAGLALGLSETDIANGMRSFPGLVHRMEVVARIGGVLFVNDTKATNADAAARALSSYDNVYWIAGGRAKDGGIADLAPFFGRIRKAYLIGEAAPAFAATLAGRAVAEQCGTLENAVVAAAHDAAKQGLAQPVVLFSPACASFDQFANFEVRGDAFKAAVHALKEDLREAREVS